MTTFPYPDECDFWGNGDGPIFPTPPANNYAPPPTPTPVVSNPPPIWTLMGLDNGFIGYIKTG